MFCGMPPRSGVRMRLRAFAKRQNRSWLAESHLVEAVEEGQVQRPQQARHFAHCRGQHLHLCLRQMPAADAHPGQTGQEAQVALPGEEVHLGCRQRHLFLHLCAPNTRPLPYVVCVRAAPDLCHLNKTRLTLYRAS